MPNVKIKVDENGFPVCSGIHFDHPDRWPRLEPGQIVDIPEDAEFEDGENVLEDILKYGKAVVTSEPANRRLDGTYIEQSLGEKTEETEETEETEVSEQ